MSSDPDSDVTGRLTWDGNGNGDNASSNIGARLTLDGDDVPSDVGAGTRDLHTGTCLEGDIGRSSWFNVATHIFVSV